MLEEESSKIIDLAEVLERVQDDRELLLELFDIFEEDYNEKRQQLDAFITQKNFDEIRDIVHSVKGASGNISAKLMHATCAHLELLAERKDLALIKQMMSALDEQFADLIREIENIRRQFKKG